ncbi:hypothetical protein [Palleronia sp. LCG004]|uniref:hypothetical protein n=1 Tax=Palleronia sp. LCG004 TaxID=3079304 RepID=UPI002941D341|nr:hypothetical protein [Palleronia sp. LCG004]WOI56431.1 hypothetical protein RVY76_01150 [Palleronia sp. LCG004]
MNRLTSTAIAALVAVPFAIAQPALAQSSSDTNSDTDMSTSSSSESGQSGSSGMSDTGSSTSSDSTASDSSSSASGDSDMSGSSDMASPDEDAVVVSVGDSDITAADVTAAISALPPQMQQTPPEQLVPFAVEQLVLRELILQDAEEQGITGDVSDDQPEMAQENATIEAYLNQQMEGVVTDDAVQEAYDEVAADTEEELPPLEAVRPQIEQQLRQERLAELRSDLMDGVEIVYYGPDGEPRETMGAQGSSSDGSMSDDSSTDSGMSSDDSSSSEGGMSGDASSESEMSTDSDTSSGDSGSSSGSSSDGSSSSDSSTNSN